MFKVKKIREIPPEDVEFEVLIPEFESGQPLSDVRKLRVAPLEKATTPVLKPSLVASLYPEGPIRKRITKVVSVEPDITKGYAGVIVDLGGRRSQILVSNSIADKINGKARLALPVEGSTPLPSSTIDDLIASQPAGDYALAFLESETYGQEQVIYSRRMIGIHKLHVNFKEDPLQGRVILPVHVPLFRLHCPKKRGCKAFYGFADATSRNFSGELSIAGIGGGAGKAIDLKWEDTVITEDGRCLQEYIDGELDIVYGSYLIDGVEVSYGSRVTVNIKPGKDNYVRQEELTKADDLCDTDAIAKLSLIYEKELKVRDSKNVCAISVARKTNGKFTVGLDSQKIPLKFSLKCEGSTSHEGNLSVELAAGRHYEGYSMWPLGRSGELPFSEVFWRTTGP